MILTPIHCLVSARAMGVGPGVKFESILQLQGKYFYLFPAPGLDYLGPINCISQYDPSHSLYFYTGGYNIFGFSTYSGTVLFNGGNVDVHSLAFDYTLGKAFTLSETTAYSTIYEIAEVFNQNFSTNKTIIAEISATETIAAVGLTAMDQSTHYFYVFMNGGYYPQPDTVFVIDLMKGIIVEKLNTPYPLYDGLFTLRALVLTTN